jgi:hypothetical protein
MIPMIPLKARSTGANPFGVSVKRLADRTVRLRDVSLENCALVPLFDAQGVTAKVVLLSPRTRECWVLDWRPGLVRVPWLRAVRMDMPRVPSLRPAAAESLWLFDRQGLIDLGIASLCGRAVASNAADVLPKTVVGLTWRRDLSRIAGVWMKKKGGGTELGQWKADWLADASPQPTARACPSPAAEASLPPGTEAPGRLKGGWVLDPIWMR